ncbi:MAG TPA: hypothetical protein VN380_11250 [Thermoanaerobaculia bacterium]|jgi:hypothetical protein|nr:hypothetical protein [Thermoanaerobaculia bacterium]
MDDFIPTEPPPAAPLPEPPAPALPFRRPADYYAAPGHDLRPLVPRGAHIGCGWASVVFVILLFAAGAFAPRSGVLLGKLFGMIGDDISVHFTRDVTPVQKAAFAAEMKRLRAATGEGKLKLDKTQSFLKLATDVDADDKVDHAEADKLIAALRDLNRSVK